jgi:hypothetical protein
VVTARTGGLLVGVLIRSAVGLLCGVLAAGGRISRSRPARGLSQFRPIDPIDYSVLDERRFAFSGR